MIKKLLLVSFIAAMICGNVQAAVELDTDANGGVDVNKGGTNSTSAANARTALGVPATAATLAGSCTVGPCLDGTSDGGDLVKLYGPGGFWTAIQAGNALANITWRLPLTLPAAGTTRLLNADEYGNQGLVDPATFLTPSGVGSSLTVTATGFNGNLSTDDNTVQEIAQKLDDLVASGSDDQTASEVPFTPNGSIAATNTQAAIQEVRDEAGSGHTALSINATPNGLSVDGSQVLTLAAASTSGAGAVVAATAPAAGLYNYVGITNGETAYTNKALFDATAPSTQASGDSAAVGSAAVAARRDHKHAMPTIPTVSDTAYNATSWDTNTDAPSKNAVRDRFEALLPSGADGEYGAWLTNNTVNPTTYSTGKTGFAYYNSIAYFCINGTCSAIGTNPMTTAGDMVKGGTSGVPTRMIPASGVVSFLETSSSANLDTAVTDDVGSGYLMFNTAPTVVTSIAPTSANGATLGTTALEFGNVYLTDSAVIYGQADQSNSITSSATGWNFNLPIGMYQANDPDVAAEGKMGWDANGNWLRVHDGTNQVAVARATECYDATIVKPNDLADGTRDAFRMWQNNSGMSFVVTSWTAQSGTDNTDVNIETTTNTGGTNATVDAVSITTDGTGMYYSSDSTITAGTITTGSIIWLDFDDTDDPAWVSVSVCGYYNGDVN
jgi:hypothetical protein